MNTGKNHGEGQDVEYKENVDEAVVLAKKRY